MSSFYIQRTLGYGLDALPWMLIAAAAFLAALPFCRREWAAEELAWERTREAGLLALTVYAAALAALTLLPCSIWDALRGRGSLFPADPLGQAAAGLRYAMLTPFGEIGKSLSNPWDFYMLTGNLLLFVPLGVFVSLLWRRARWYRTVLTGAVVSCLIETAQLFVGRSTSIDDVILNTVGAALGYGLFCGVYYRWPCFVKRFWTRPMEDWELEELDAQWAWEDEEDAEDTPDALDAPYRAAEHGWGDETRLLWRSYFTREGGNEV